ncbi:MAG: AI-2E family transporter [Patescibacteria group bacterium]
MEEKHSFSITTGSLVRAVAVVAIAYALFLVHSFVLVVITAVVIASAVEPAARWAGARKIPRVPAVLSVYVSVTLILAGLFYFLFLPLLSDASAFIRTLPAYSETVNSEAITTSILEPNTFQNFSANLPVAELSSYFNSLASSLSQGIFSSASLVFGGVLSFVLIIVLSFYLAVQDDGVSKFLRIIVPARKEQYVVGLWKRSQQKIGLWMQGQLLLAVIVMVLVYLGLMLIGVPHALLLAVLAGVFEIIPLFGPILSAIPSVFVAFASGGTSLALIVAGLYLIIQQFENHLIYPLVVKKVVGVPPTVSILALVVGGQLAGFLGMLISVPIAAVLMEFLSDVEREKMAQAKEA